ncbi:MAG: ATP-binding cassette domain-containing protein [Flavobacterium sp.]|uniref:ABC transporter ATP-binding protein n=1 Tax=Flavobacterium sp. TaxID=239 RepID=UPI001220CEEC|nr:ABC transporter ATP-binding protein [Flavobacterium sp.]RZJ66073.1 MAG: ATP-binding cassette domain-containing protein [Flavobacterium sp.]
MAEKVIKVDNLGKAYQIGQFGTGTITRDMERFWAMKVRRKEDPFLKIGETNDRSRKGDSDIVWSLRDINFEVNQGDAVGIVGKNGAGKSTLLKLLSRVTAPTLGEIKVKGRIASLLEVGTGFHPDLTGRENLYLNGAILGMRKKEITRKLDEIVEFSGVERYIDTPVKRYSSGMYVRLAFAVAAHLESEILIVDEVLAVGDAEFQKKCLGKMGDISKGQGRTVLFVSHNMAAVKNLCSNGILLKNGTVAFNGDVNECVSRYLAQDDSEISGFFANTNSNEKNSVATIRILGDQAFHQHEETVAIEVVFKQPASDCYVGIALLNSDKNKIFTTMHFLDKPVDSIVCEIPSKLLLKGSYSLDVATFKGNTVFEYHNDICAFGIVDLVNDFQIYGANIGDIKVDCKWYEN